MRRVGAAVLLASVDGFVLLMRRSSWTDHGGTWGIPAGAVEAGETPREAALRELAEETGISASVSKLPWRVVRHRDGDGVLFVFAGLVPKRNTPVFADGEHDLHAWVRVSDVPMMSPLHPAVSSICSLYGHDLSKTLSGIVA